MSPTYSVCKEHGYITGEVGTCPKCGKETEIYSRITGYYRPVKNWNAGKTQEFKMRKTYVIDGENTCEKECCEEKEEVVKTKEYEDKIVLFGTSVCPNCKMAKEFLNKKEIEFEWVNAEENPEYTKEIGVKQAPTLVVFKDGNIEKIPKKLPIFMVAGDADPVGEYGKSVQSVFETYKQAGVEDIRLKLYAGDRHEILNELDKETVYTDIYNWLEEHIG